MLLTTSLEAPDDLLGCVGVSLEHADGTTECTEGHDCELPHHLHAFVASCSELSPPCPCAPEEAVFEIDLLLAA